MSCRGLDMLEGAKSIGAGAATIALAGAAVGIGNVLSSSIHSVARNPSLAKQSFGYAILGFALTEAIALFAPMMAFLISFGSHRKRDTEAPTYLPGRWGKEEWVRGLISLHSTSGMPLKRKQWRQRKGTLTYFEFASLAKASLNYFLSFCLSSHRSCFPKPHKPGQRTTYGLILTSLKRGRQVM
ncbi:ATP synthase subunit C family protein [Gossypium australe]|uniref:ATP synthase subunit 9, mitochondrial n=1 Tax=Gossypium australe TaxID=47621 RepID=A0A5B6TYW6_9ROSI|nr:ATP synthase subunit C family protein [Gossypium australe]